MTQTADDTGQQPGQDIAPHRVPVPVGIPVSSLDEAWRLSQALGNSVVAVPKDLRGKPADILAVLLYGRELGLSAWQSIQGINIIKGRVSMSTELRVAKTRERGHVIGVTCRTCGEFAHHATHQVGQTRGGEEFHRYVADWDDRRCAVKGVRGDTGEIATAVWTVEDAVRAGLLRPGRVGSPDEGKLVSRSTQGEPMPWELYTRNMLHRRATNDVARIIAPEVGYGLYDPDELPDERELVEAVVGEPVADDTVDPDEARRAAQAAEDEFAGEPTTEGT